MASPSPLAARVAAALPCRRAHTTIVAPSGDGARSPEALGRTAFDSSRRSVTSGAIPEHGSAEPPGDPQAAELAEMKESHEKLKRAIKIRVHRAMSDHNIVAATDKKFVETSLGTIAGWITAQTFYLAILRVLDYLNLEEALVSFIARLIYAVVASVVVPLIDWSLRNVAPDEAHFLADQVNLVKVCLPMFFAWAWKDVVSAALALAGGAVWWELLTTLAVTSVVVVVETLPSFRSATRAVQERGDGDTPLARMVAMLQNLALAVGFTWNFMFSKAPKHIFSFVRAPMYIFMVQVVYYVVVTTLIILIALRLRRRGKGTKQHDTAAEEELDPERSDTAQLVMRRVSSIAAELEEAGFSVVISALHFVYAWAQLDTVNALFFNYLLGCDSAGACGYRNNFYFAFLASLVFARATAALKCDGRVTSWNKESAALMIKAFPMNTGWAWAGYCSAAIANAGTYVPFDPLWSYLLCTAFAWMAISVIHRNLEVELRAWDRHCKAEADSCELILH